MKSTAILLASLLLSLSSWAYSLNVRVSGGATYNYEITSASEMLFDTRDGKHYLTLQGHEFDLGGVELLYIGSEVLAPNTVNVVYNGEEAEVFVAGNLVDYVSAERTAADVNIAQSADVSEAVCGEITYTLRGASGNGSFAMTGNYMATVLLDGLQLTSLTTAPINIANGKRIAVKLAEDTTNRLSDAAGGSHKGALACKGHLEFKQRGSLEVVAKSGHGIFAKEYVEIKNSNITIKEAAKDGINCTQYFLMESGSLNILASGDDGVQVDYKDSENRETEDTGSIMVTGGEINVLTTADAAKCLKAENGLSIAGGKLTLEVRGNGLWDATKGKTKAAACLSADGELRVADGELLLTATGSGGKGLASDGALTIDGGTLRIKTSGGLLVYSNGALNHNYTGNTDRISTNYKSSPKGIKADGSVVINGGVIDIYTSGNGAEGIESKSTLTVNGGNLNVKAYDDGMNSAADMTIAGGEIHVVSTAGDGLDSNANIIVTGGTLCTFGGGGMEQGLDAATESGCSVRFTGGTILAAGGGNSAPTSSATQQPFVSVSGMTLKAGNEVTIKSGDTILATWTVPAYYGTTSTPLAAPLRRGPGGGPGGSSSSGTVLSAPGLINGQSYTITAGTTTSTATAKLK